MFIKTNQPTKHRSLPGDCFVWNLGISYVWLIVNLTWSTLNNAHQPFLLIKRQGRFIHVHRKELKSEIHCWSLKSWWKLTEVHSISPALSPADITDAHLTECHPLFPADQQHNKNSVQKGVRDTSPCTPGSTDHNIFSNAIYTMKTVMCHRKKSDAFALTFAKAENWVSGKSLIPGAPAGIRFWLCSTGGKQRKRFPRAAEGQEVYRGPPSWDSSSTPPPAQPALPHPRETPRRHGTAELCRSPLPPALPELREHPAFQTESLWSLSCRQCRILYPHTCTEQCLTWTRIVFLFWGVCLL